MKSHQMMMMMMMPVAARRRGSIKGPLLQSPIIVTSARAMDIRLVSRWYRATLNYCGVLWFIVVFRCCYMNGHVTASVELCLGRIETGTVQREREKGDSVGELSGRVTTSTHVPVAPVASSNTC